MEDVMSRIIPRSLSEKLKAGESIIPQLYTSVSVLIIGIANFSDITRRLDPPLVVSFLDFLNSSIDDEISKYDVFKTEYSSEQIVIASGVPNKQYLKHVVNCAAISLSVCESCKKKWSKEDSNVKPVLKCGFHVGPASSGVIGGPAPRFVVYGEAEHMARQLYITAAPGKIHISSTVAKTLYQIGGFSIAKEEQNGKVRYFIERVS